MRISDWSSDVCSSDLESRCQPHPRGRVVARALPRPRFTIDAGFDGLLAQGVGDQGQVDAQAQVAAEGGLAVVPPAEDAAGVVVQAEGVVQAQRRSEEHTSELQSLMRISYAVFCLKTKNKNK